MENTPKCSSLKKYVLEACLKRMILKITAQIMEQRQAIGRCLHAIIGMRQRGNTFTNQLSPRELKTDSTVILKRNKLAKLIKRRRILTRQLKQLD
jgi:pyrimidine operon attenuation protein/uracil phosphoribosyltransferase